LALNDVYADRYFGRYRGKNGHTASTREPTRLTHSSHLRGAGWVMLGASKAHSSRQALVGKRPEVLLALRTKTWIVSPLARI
jgi:hypothetical protein